MKDSERIATLRNARKVIRNCNKRIARMKKNLEHLTSKNGVEVGSELERDISAIIDSNNSAVNCLPLTDFRRIFWNQQV